MEQLKHELSMQKQHRVHVGPRRRIGPVGPAATFKSGPMRQPSPRVRLPLPPPSVQLPPIDASGRPGRLSHHAPPTEDGRTSGRTSPTFGRTSPVRSVLAGRNSPVRGRAQRSEAGSPVPGGQTRTVSFR